jgi:hypothetical protein
MRVGPRDPDQFSPLPEELGSQPICDPDHSRPLSNKVTLSRIFVGLAERPQGAERGDQFKKTEAQIKRRAFPSNSQTAPWALCPCRGRSRGKPVLREPGGERDAQFGPNSTGPGAADRQNSQRRQIAGTTRSGTTGIG